MTNPADIKKLHDAARLPDALDKATNNVAEVTPGMRRNSAEWEKEDAQAEADKYAPVNHVDSTCPTPGLRTPPAD